MEISANSEISNDTDDEQKIKEYVEEFRKEVERKFKKSKMNKNYILKNIKSTHKIDINKSLDSNSKSSTSASLIFSLGNGSVYDLNAQNFKYEIEDFNNNSVHYNENENLAELLSRIGKLDKKYIYAQIKRPDSKLFKYLCQNISKKIESLKGSCSNYSHFTSLYLNNNKTPNFENTEKIILKKNNNNNNKTGALSLNYNKKFINLNNTSYNKKTDKIKSKKINNYIEDKIKKIENNNKKQHFLNKKSINSHINLTSKNKSDKSNNINRITINSKLLKNIQKKITINNTKKNNKSKKLKKKINTKITNTKNNQKSYINNRITLTKEELNSLINKGLNLKNNKNNYKLNNKGVNIINNTKNIVTISNIKK